jgi:hypothetical protein
MIKYTTDGVNSDSASLITDFLVYIEDGNIICKTLFGQDDN